MSKTLKVAIVNGYGVMLDDSYKKHLDTVTERGDEFEYIIVSGGYTSKMDSSLSESTIMAGYLEGKNSNLKGKIIEENKALTTRQNLIFALAKLNEILKLCWVNEGVNLLDITVFCKKPWWLKVKLLSWIILRPRRNWLVKIKVSVRVQGTAPADGWKQWVKQLLATSYEVLSVFIPRLEEYKIRKKFPWKFVQEEGECN